MDLPEQHSGMDPNSVAPEDAEAAWAALNAARRSAVLKYVYSKPIRRLPIIREAITPLHDLTTSFLGLAGAKWERQQSAAAAMGRSRSYIVLEAAMGRQVDEAMRRSLGLLFQDVPGTLPGDVTCSQRVLRLGMLCGALCGLHSLLRIPRRGMPYAMFLLLQDNSPAKAEALLRTPACMTDPLWASLCQRFPDSQAMQSEEFLAVLETLAGLVSVDVAAIEAGHSMTRELCQLRSRGWFSSLESVASKWAVHQNLRFRGKTSDSAHVIKHTTNKKSSEPKPRRGGGGCWRAFTSIRLRGSGRALDGATMSQLSLEYRRLSAEEREEFAAIGRAGALAHRHGFASFGERGNSSNRSDQRPAGMLPGAIRADGAIVAMDAARDDLGMVPHSGASFLDKYHEFKTSAREKDPPALKPEEEAALQEFRAKLPDDQQLRAWRQTAHQSLTADLKCLGARQPSLASVTWDPPIHKAIQACFSVLGLGFWFMATATVMVMLSMFMD